ncbi:hypothetical protein CIG19_04615 [Enterobacterales bacterium CwR94]|nr:hypothetical protein CIG19_04615 [Enterobacterales bacterium CwR94]
MGCIAALPRQSPLLMAIIVGVTSYRDLFQRESQLLHKYDGSNTRPESFQRISNLSGKRTQVKCRSYSGFSRLLMGYPYDL